MLASFGPCARAGMLCALDFIDQCILLPFWSIWLNKSGNVLRARLAFVAEGRVDFSHHA